MRAGIYVRISMDRQGKRAGVERQLADCRALCAARGWEIVQTYEDNDRSAFSGKGRPEYEHLVNDVASGRVEAVVAWHTDRIWRDVLDQQLFLVTAKRAGLRVVATMNHDIDPADADDEMMSTFMAAVARKESADKSRRMKRRHADKAAKGEFHGGPPGYGYRLDGAGSLIVDEAEAAIVREIANRLLAGETQRGIVLDLHRRGITTSTGRPWRVDTVYKLMQSARIAGLRVHEGVETPGLWPAIITPATRRALLVNYSTRRLGKRERPTKHLLSGMVRCGACGAPMTVSTIRGSLRYRCQPKGMGGCGGMSVVALHAESAAVERVLEYIAGPELEAALARASAAAEDNDGRLRGVNEQMVRDRTQLVTLGDLLADGGIDPVEYRRLRERLQGRIEDAEAMLRRAAPALRPAQGLQVQAGQLRSDWQLLTLEERRTVLSAVVERFDVHRGQAAVFSPERIRPVWRFV